MQVREKNHELILPEMICLSFFKCSVFVIRLFLRSRKHKQQIRQVSDGQGYHQAASSQQQLLFRERMKLLKRVGGNLALPPHGPPRNAYLWPGEGRVRDRGRGKLLKWQYPSFY